MAVDGTIAKVGAPAPQEIVFVDPNVRDFQTLVDGIDNPNARIVLLDPQQRGAQFALRPRREQRHRDRLRSTSSAARMAASTSSVLAKPSRSPS